MVLSIRSIKLISFTFHYALRFNGKRGSFRVSSFRIPRASWTRPSSRNFRASWNREFRWFVGCAPVARAPSGRASAIVDFIDLDSGGKRLSGRLMESLKSYALAGGWEDLLDGPPSREKLEET